MKNWKSRSTPSNRDKLELFALHKQSVSGDAPLKDPLIHSSSPHSVHASPIERAKLNSWQTKRGLSQTQAMTAYIVEADRQLLVHGTALVSSSSPTTTPRNTPNETHAKDECSQQSNSVLLTPRGLAAVPLLCAAASENRRSYLQRLGSTATSCEGAFAKGWWKRQEPLCGDPGTLLALPETILIAIATALESFSLSLNDIATIPIPATTTESSSSTVSKTVSNAAVTIITHFPSTIPQSLLWPLHNTLLVVWMLIIFLSTLTGSTIIATKTMMMLNEKTIGTVLVDIFLQEIKPSMIATEELRGNHQAMGVRLLGLALYPLGIVCKVADQFRMRWSRDSVAVAVYVASAIYVSSIVFLWWYWFVVLPWIAITGLLVSVGFGWCFGLVELVNVSSLKDT